jgi:hypothetical protein
MSAWRRRCPDGHLAWRPQGDGYWCESCGETFARLIDAKTGRVVS